MAGFISRMSYVADETTDGTAGHQSTHAHGLARSTGGGITPSAVMVVPKAAANDSDNGGAAVSVVSFDSTNVVVKSTGTSVKFDILAVSEM